MKYYTALMVSASVLIFSTAASAHTCKYDVIESTAPAERFITQADGTVLDASTGLAWMACPYGTTLVDDGCAGSAKSFENWSDALMLTEVVNNEKMLGYEDWRLPNSKELASLVEYACFAPAISVEAFPDTPSASFWTNTPDTRGVNPGLLGKVIDFTYGVEDLSTAGAARNRIYVRMVRDMN